MSSGGAIPLEVTPFDGADDTEPGFANNDPNTAVYNHVWVLGGEDAVSQGAQGRIDQATSLLPVDQSAAPVE